VQLLLLLVALAVVVLEVHLQLVFLHHLEPVVVEEEVTDQLVLPDLVVPES
jgi:hypothetical protein